VVRRAGLLNESSQVSAGGTPEAVPPYAAARGVPALSGRPGLRVSGPGTSDVISDRKGAGLGSDLISPSPAPQPRQPTETEQLLASWVGQPQALPSWSPRRPAGEKVADPVPCGLRIFCAGLGRADLLAPDPPCVFHPVEPLQAERPRKKKREKVGCNIYE